MFVFYIPLFAVKSSIRKLEVRSLVLVVLVLAEAKHQTLLTIAALEVFECIFGVYLVRGVALSTGHVVLIGFIRSCGPIQVYHAENRQDNDTNKKHAKVADTFLKPRVTQVLPHDE